VALIIASRELDGVTILDLSRRITLGEGSVQIRDAIRDLIGKGQKNILLNLGDVNYIDSSGLGELVSAFTSAKNQGASLKLLNLTKKIHDLLQLTKL
jgi:anti-sigma B factor antagonist